MTAADSELAFFFFLLPSVIDGAAAVTDAIDAAVEAVEAVVAGALGVVVAVDDRDDAVVDDVATAAAAGVTAAGVGAGRCHAVTPVAAL
jgi:hypothetical protein